MDKAEYDPIDFPHAQRTEPAKLYLISPQDVSGGFPDRLKAALEPAIAATFQLRVKDVDEHELARLAEPLQRFSSGSILDISSASAPILTSRSLSTTA